mgnify:FL=1
MNNPDITITAQDVERAVKANPAVDWALKEQALLRVIEDLKEEVEKLNNGSKPKGAKDAKT